MNSELLNPWRLTTLAIGIALLVAGSFYWDATDWDIGICFVMAFFTYLTSTWCLRTLLDATHHRRLSWSVAGALFAWWWSVDGCYWIYHAIMGNQMIRFENFFASTALYFACGVIWMWDGKMPKWRVS